MRGTFIQSRGPQLSRMTPLRFDLYLGPVFATRPRTISGISQQPQRLCFGGTNPPHLFE